MILCIETATSICSVALVDDGVVKGLRESSVDKSHAALLTLFIEELLGEAGINASGLDAVAVSKGPGSYTGLRIGVSAAKGICYGASVPLISVGTLESVYYGTMALEGSALWKKSDAVICPMIDARRMEVYSALYTVSGELIRGVEAEVIDESGFADILSSRMMVFTGNGAAKCKEVITGANAVYPEGYQISASSLAIPATLALKNRRFEDVAYFEPCYLKDFIATVPKKSILGG